MHHRHEFNDKLVPVAERDEKLPVHMVDPHSARTGRLPMDDPPGTLAADISWISRPEP
ncbi:hypothetical protein J6590_003517 [Homalodisca vitripennis]|nr:hypothetical protein J6590_003517 [Homalodisca vitripennis]